MKPSGLRSVSSASLATEVQSKQHPLLKFSFVPPTSQRGIRKVDFHNRCLESGSGPYLPMLLSPGNLKNKKQKQPTNTKVTVTKEQTPDLKYISGTAGMGQGILWSFTVNRRGGPMFWKGVAFDTSSPQGRPSSNS